MIVCLRKLSLLCRFCCNFFWQIPSFFFFLVPFEFFHADINQSSGIVWWCSHRIAGSVNLFALYSLHALSFLQKVLVSLLYFCVYVCERDITLITPKTYKSKSSGPLFSSYVVAAASSVEELHLHYLKCENGKRPENRNLANITSSVNIWVEESVFWENTDEKGGIISVYVAVSICSSRNIFVYLCHGALWRCTTSAFWIWNMLNQCTWAVTIQ